MVKFRVGTACHITEWLDTKDGRGVTWGKKKGMSLGKITLKHLRKFPRERQFDMLYEKTAANLEALEMMQTEIAFWPDTARMFRIGSDLIPMIDHPDYEDWFKTGPLHELIVKRLEHIGELFKVHDTRLSCHPSQFITLFSDREEVNRKSLKHIEAWIRLFQYMGYTPSDGVVIVLHTNGKARNFPSFASHVKPWIGLENDEKQAGFNKTLRICQDEGIRMVIDVHHYRCELGRDFNVNSDEFFDVLSTWPAGGRPKMHISSSRGTESKEELCAHADFISKEDLEKFKDHAYYFDIMVEAKAKSLAAGKVHRFLLENLT